MFPGSHLAFKSFPTNMAKSPLELSPAHAVGWRPPCSLFRAHSLPLLHPRRSVSSPWSLVTPSPWELPEFQYVGSLTSFPHPHSEPGKVVSRKPVLMKSVCEWLTPGIQFYF